MTADSPPSWSGIRLRTLATTTSAVLWNTSPDGNVADDNPSWQAFTGQGPTECAGLGWLEAIHPDDRAAIQRLWQDGIASRSLVKLQYRLRRHDGEYRQMEAQGVPVLVDDEIREWVGISLDVTDSRRAAAALKASEERLRLLDRISQATRTSTDAMQIMAVTARLLGEHLGATRCAYADVEADNDRFTIRSDWSAEGVDSSAGAYSLDLFGAPAATRLRQGRNLVVDDVERELGDDGGAPMFRAIGIQAIVCAPLVKDARLVALMAVHDAAPRHWSDEEIAIVAEVVDRCWAHIERVRDAAMLREKDRRKDEFLATLAHELRNPLAPMRYALTMQRMSADPARGRQARDILERQVNHMSRLIEDLLDQSRIDRGQIELRPERVSLSMLMEHAVEASRPEIEAAGHRLVVHLPRPDILLDADPARLVQVIGNLLNNAAKYTPDGGDIRLSAWQRGDEACIEVVDNGIGIPPDEQGRLFQMFTQLNHSAHRAKGGLGIGLSLVRSLVEMQGGQVKVESAGLDAGSTFTLALPLPRGADPLPPERSAPDGAARPPGRRILVVEDNPDGLEALVALLDLLGHATCGAGDGVTGLSAAAQFDPELILLDLGLPDMDGHDVARALRADPRHAGVVLVALTGWGSVEDRARTTRAGFDHHLTKPIDPDRLESFLETALSDRPEAPR